MNKITCTFPSYKFRRVTRNEDVLKGDKFNHRNPKVIPNSKFSFDYWSDCEQPDCWSKEEKSKRKGWIIIRPI
jgi:hypothetical protein